MKNIIHFFLCLSLIGLSVQARQILDDQAESPTFSSAFSAGYVFKNDCRFKEVYGHGMVDIITGAFVWYPWDFWGFGAKVSYWRAKGSTTFLNFCTKLHEIPLTFTVQRLLIFKHDIQMYFSLGGGVAWLKEQSCLECIKLHKGIGELEVGFNFPIYKPLKLTTAFRYVFPPQCFCGEKIDVGGCDLRAGLLLSF